MTHRRSRLRVEPLEDRRLLTADLYITEFMASNDNTLIDGFGDSSDWIELFNDGSSAIELGGHYLTDDALDLTKWQFPSHTLEPGQSVIVFASEQNTVLPNGEMHTDFRLSAAGEYLGLVDTDGTTVLQDFGAQYPPQFEDISYGIGMQLTGSTNSIVASGDTISAFEPSNGSLGTSWTAVNFDDSAWPVSGPSPVGWENSPGDYAGLIQTDLLSNATSVYLRYEFDLSSLSNIASLELGMRYDDGFVAYLNGMEIAAANDPDTLSWNSIASANHPDNEAVNFEFFDASTGISALELGQNVLAIHGLNVSTTSSDLLFDAQLVSDSATVTIPFDVGFQVAATPGGANSALFDGFTSTVDFSLPHGFYESSQSLALSTTTTDSSIVYTTDGSEPTVDASLNVTNGNLYSGAINVNQTSVVRAKAFKLGFEAAPSVAQTYLFLDDVLQQGNNGQAPVGWPNSNVNGQELDYGMDLNVINTFGEQAVKDALLEISTFSITTDVDNLFDPADGIYVNAENGGRSWERFSSVELIEPDGSIGFQSNAGLRIRGGFSRGDFNPKHAFRLYFRGEYGASKLEYPLFGDEGTDTFDVLDLRTAQNYSWSSGGDFQNTFVREVFSRDTQRDLGDDYTRSRYHHLYINGTYWGLFQTQERVEEFYGETYLGGDADDYDLVKSGIRTTGGPTEIAEGNDEAWRDLFDLAQGLAVNPSAFADNYFTVQGLDSDGTRDTSLPVLLDMENLIDYMVVLFYTGNFDSGLSAFIGNNVGNNWFGLRNRENNDQGFVFFQHDAEHSLGVNGSEFEDRTGPFNEGNQDNFLFSNPQYLHQDLAFSDEYRLAFADRVHKHFFNDGVLTPAASTERLNQRVDVVQDVILAESVRWGDSKTEPARTPVHWQNEINTIYPYLNTRGNTVLNQLIQDGLYPSIDAPDLSLHGGQVPFGFQISFSAPSGSIYFTTDGTDPREFGGAISSGATLFTGSPISINADTVVKARVLQGGQWSALTEAEFTLFANPATAANFRITELNFNPADATTAELAINASLDNDDFEFVELRNTGPVPIDIADVSFDVGSVVTLPTATVQPGEYALIVADQSAFELRYGTGLPIVAENNLSGLSNSGELVSVLGANGSVIHSFTYDDAGNWPSFADGHGETMEVIDTAGDYEDPLNWLPSRDPLGTPGTSDPLSNSTSALRVTEIMYNPVLGTGSEFVEVLNSSSSTLNLTGHRFIEGVEIEFGIGAFLPAGQRGVIVNDLTEFEAVYGVGLPVIGVFSDGSLSNGGERIITVDSAGDLVHDFVYDDAAPWPTSPDGGGNSLEVIDINGDYSDPFNWQPSAVVGGTPGTTNNVSGDFNGDGALDCFDINALTAAVAGSSNDLMYDVDANGVVNALDVEFWVTDLKGTLIGDANLDFVVDGLDFVIWNEHKFSSNNQWCDGDFTADGVIDGLDFVAWNQNKFTSALLKNADAEQLPDSDEVSLPAPLPPAARFAPTDAAIAQYQRTEFDFDRIVEDSDIETPQTDGLAMASRELS